MPRGGGPTPVARWAARRRLAVSRSFPWKTGALPSRSGPLPGHRTRYLDRRDSGRRARSDRWAGVTGPGLARCTAPLRPCACPRLCGRCHVDVTYSLKSAMVSCRACPTTHTRRIPLSWARYWYLSLDCSRYVSPCHRCRRASGGGAGGEKRHKGPPWLVSLPRPPLPGKGTAPLTWGQVACAC